MDHIFDTLEFLRESNNIEDEWDDLSLQQAYLAWIYLSEEKVIDTSNILKTHKILMLHQDLRSDEKGYFRKSGVSIGNRSGLSHILISKAIAQWAFNVNDLIAGSKYTEKVTIERIIKEHHVKYEIIHPFIDGNGRTGRIFMNWERIQCGLPILNIKEREKYAYYDWFKEVKEKSELQKLTSKRISSSS